MSGQLQTSFDLTWSPIFIIRLNLISKSVLIIHVPPNHQSKRVINLLQKVGADREFLGTGL
jgi:hypothetical protein